jgi:hypothetical protein
VIDLTNHSGTRMATLSVETFSSQISEAIKQYDRTVVCLEKLPDSFESTVKSLVHRAILVFNKRNEGQRHGLALDKYVTVILSQTDGPVPLCAIYFNLSSPYLNDPRIRSSGSLPATP